MLIDITSFFIFLGLSLGLSIGNEFFGIWNTLNSHLLCD